MPAASRTQRAIGASLLSLAIVLPAVFSVPVHANGDRQTARQAQKAAQRAEQYNQQRATRFKGITARSRPTQQQAASSDDDKRGAVSNPAPGRRAIKASGPPDQSRGKDASATAESSSGGENVVISDPINGRRTIRMTHAMLARLGVASSEPRQRSSRQKQHQSTARAMSGPSQQDHPAENPHARDGSNIKGVKTSIAGPGHLPDAPYRHPTGSEMLDWAWDQYLDTVNRLEETYGRVELEWVLLRNPLGQVIPGFFTPAFSVDDAFADNRQWLKQLIARYHDAGIKVVLYGNQPYRMNRGTLEEPDIIELSAENRGRFAAELARRLASIAHHLGADAIGFDSFPTAAKTQHADFVDPPYTLGSELGLPYLKDLVRRLEDAGIVTWAEGQPPVGTSFDEWPDSMHFAKLGGTQPRGVDDDDPDRPADDPKDRRTPREFKDLFESAGVPHGRGWFWLQGHTHEGEPTIDIPYNVMIPTPARW